MTFSIIYKNKFINFSLLKNRIKKQGFKVEVLFFYSLLNAIAASFLAAILAGMCPPSIVKIVLIITKIKACVGSS